MRSELDDPKIQPYRILDYQLEATLYNTIRLGMLRIANPLIITPDNPPNVKCYFFDNKWLCVDLTRDEYPLVMWKDFNTTNRGLHEPILCKVHVYHIMAGRLMGTVLYAVENHLNKTYNKDNRKTV